MASNKYDFSGWATRNDIRCSDGRTIRRNAFKECDGSTVPLVWNHDHNSIDRVVGHALLENRDEGVYCYGSLNDTPQGLTAKELITHGDITALSIYANRLKQNKGDVLHGAIKEVSLVLAGANPGAYIDAVLEHADGSVEEAYIFSGDEIDPSPVTVMIHSATNEVQETFEPVDDPSMKEETPMENENLTLDLNDEINHADGEGETIKDIFDTLSEKQKTVVYALIGAAMEGKDGGDENMKHNAFDNDEGYVDGSEVLTHAEILEIISDGKRMGSLKEAVLQHGIEEIETLFPEPKSLNNPPEWIKRDTTWVADVMGRVHHTPFSRIKSSFADITEDEARAKGYIKGKLKKEEVFSLLKRTTTPQTVYKKQKLDRDDVIDITDFDVVAWLKAEMRMMLEEELARAFLIGDGRLNSDDDKIKEDNIRPIWKDAELYTIRSLIDTTKHTDVDSQAKTFIRAAIKSRKNYKGSGNPVLYTTEDMLTDCLLLEDKNGRVIYDTEEKLRTALRVSKIVTVPVMENQKRQDAEQGNKDRTLLGLIVNLSDYNVGADKGGAVSMFDDFDIDYNAQKYLIETRCSGALIKPYAAIAIEAGEPGESQTEGVY